MAGKLQIDIDKLQNIEHLRLMRYYENLVTASHATNYSFQPETNEWKKRDIEGPFFVVEGSQLGKTKICCHDCFEPFKRK